MALPFVISVPHCSGRMPAEIRSELALNEQQVTESVDYGTQEIFAHLPAQATIVAQWSRLLVDLNRGPDETGSKGVVAHTDYHGRSIYPPGTVPDQAAIAERLARYHRPFHSQIEQAMRDTSAIGLIDGHSLNGIGPADAPDPGETRKDVILSNYGDREGAARNGFGPTSCSRELLHIFKDRFVRNGFSVALNAPYQGGYTVKHYGRQLVADGRFAVQIEMNQNLYMQPSDLTPQEDRVAAVAQKVLSALGEIASILTPGDLP